jgi:autotransporter-associated beta strand protein
MNKIIPSTLVIGLLVLTNQLSLAASATWKLDPTSDDWNTAGNWSPNTVPRKPADTATFDLSNLTGVSLLTTITISGVTFNSDASPFTIAVGEFINGGGGADGSLTVQGPGVINNSATTQIFVSTGSNAGSHVSFADSASAGSNVVYNNMPFSTMNFTGTSTAAEATIVNHTGILGIGVSGEAFLNFLDNSTAGNATVINEADEGFLFGSEIFFFDDSTAGNAFFTNKSQATLGCLIIFGDNSTAGTATFINEGNDDNAGAAMQLNGTSSADHGTFTFEPGAPNRSSSASKCDFQESATAGESTFTIQGSTAAGAPPATLTFNNTSTAGDSTLVATNGPSPNTGGSITFLADSQGGTARVELSGPTGPGTLTIGSHNLPGVTIGSVEGAGLVVLGSRNLTVGSNSLSTTFSGTIQGTGTITKIGTGSLTLGGASPYSGGTTVSQGTLVVANTAGSATGTGPVTVNAGTLGGSGTVTGAVTIGTGGGSGAFLAPATGTTIQTRLTTQSALTFNADATYTFSFKANSKHARTDMVIANGATINGATLALIGTTQGHMKRGLVLNVINNTSANPIAGTFSNVADGTIVTVNGNNLQASYEGGDGNDLTLTVVP